MSRKKAADHTPAEPEWEHPGLPCTYCGSGELAQAIAELTRQVHLLGVIIDELVSEFQWQNNQIAGDIRRADGAQPEIKHTAQEAGQPPRFSRTTLFD